MVQQQARELTLLEYGEQEPYTFQAKSSIFGASWGPVPVQPTGASIAYHPYIHHPCSTGEPDGSSVRSWALEPLPALPFTGLSTDTHHDIKLEPLVGSGECTTHTLQVAETDNNSQAERKVPDDAVSNGSQDDKTPAEKNLDVDPSKCKLSECVLIYEQASCLATQTD